jgi:hypothetical protein
MITVSAFFVAFKNVQRPASASLQPLDNIVSSHNIYKLCKILAIWPTGVGPCQSIGNCLSSLRTIESVLIDFTGFCEDGILSGRPPNASFRPAVLVCSAGVFLFLEKMCKLIYLLKYLPGN